LEYSPTLVLTITNTGTVTTGVLQVHVDGADADNFPIVEPATDCNDNIVLAPGASCSLRVQFRPLSVGSKTGTLVVEAAPGGALPIALGGVGEVEPPLSPPFYDFSIVEFGQSVVQQFVMTNGGAPPLQIESLTLAQVFGTGFTIESTTCSGTLNT